MAKQAKLTRRIKVFKATAAAYGVKSVTHREDGSATYTLANGAAFDLTPKERRAYVDNLCALKERGQ